MDIKEIREQIDVIDAQMAKLFNERMKLVEEISKYKKENKLPIYSKSREEDIKNKGLIFISPEYSDYYVRFINSVLHISKKYQEKRELQ